MPRPRPTPATSAATSRRSPTARPTPTSAPRCARRGRPSRTAAGSRRRRRPRSPSLQATVDELAGQRDSLFRGETLRGLLLSTFAWSTIGRIAGIAAIAAFVAAAAMVVLVVLGVVHRRKLTTSAEPHASAEGATGPATSAGPVRAPHAVPVAVATGTKVPPSSSRSPSLPPSPRPDNATPCPTR